MSIRELLGFGKKKPMFQGGVQTDVVLLGVNINDFVGLAEHVSPEELVVYLQGYLGVCSAEVEKEDGIVVEFAADHFVAAWHKTAPNLETAVGVAKRLSGLLRNHADKNLENGKSVTTRLAITCGSVTPTVTENRVSLFGAGYNRLNGLLNVNELKAGDTVAVDQSFPTSLKKTKVAEFKAGSEVVEAFRID